MSLLLQVQLIAQLLFAAFLCMVIGIERERSEKPAGLRTHMLAGIGACLFTMVGIHGFGMGDEGRLAAGVVTGIGFLGGGVVFRDKNHVHALTTAASIWTTAAIGVAVGAGAWLLALAATLLTWFILSSIRHVEGHLRPPKPRARGEAESAPSKD